MVTEKKEESKEKFIVGEIATDTKQVIVDTETQEQYTVELAIVKILNEIEEIKKVVG